MLTRKFLSLLKSIWFNFRYLPIKQALRLPFAIYYKSKCRVVKGGLKLACEPIKPFMIRIGFHTVSIMPEQITVLIVHGALVFKGAAHIGRGSHLVVRNGALLELGDNFAISANSYISCSKHIKLGRNIQLAWGDLLIDDDGHVIYGEDGNIINESREIILGDNIWIGCDCKVLKGTIIPNNCVVGANSIVTIGSKMEPDSLIVGSPANSIKKIKGFKI